jgi:hypothetical protein
MKLGYLRVLQQWQALRWVGVVVGVGRVCVGGGHLVVAAREHSINGPVTHVVMRGWVGG